MDKRISYKVVIDTETCPIDKDIQTVLPTNMFVYDVGWIVTDKKGNVYKERSYLAKEIFIDEPILMNSAYYREKIPKYLEEVAQGIRILTSFYEIRKTLLCDIEEYGIKEIFAHNMRFDYNSLNNTQRWLTKSKYRYFFPKKITICDTLKMARDVIATQPTYKRFCEENGYMTKNNRVRLTAEILYRYITKNNNFIENHTGLEDVMIEKEILAYCYRQHKKMKKELWAN